MFISTGIEIVVIFLLILAYLGHIPAVGDRVTIGDVTLEVVDLDGKRIDRVLISRQ
jgi:magnesium and cobalt exporter, CNNM family